MRNLAIHKGEALLVNSAVFINGVLIESRTKYACFQNADNGAVEPSCALQLQEYTKNKMKYNWE